MTVCDRWWWRIRRTSFKASWPISYRDDDGCSAAYWPIGSQDDDGCSAACGRGNLARSIVGLDDIFMSSMDSQPATASDSHEDVVLPVQPLCFPATIQDDHLAKFRTHKQKTYDEDELMDSLSDSTEVIRASKSRLEEFCRHLGFEFFSVNLTNNIWVLWKHPFALHQL
ncbi:hypothetical protein ACH5RR_029707 [Cinchona calisaya]|uniref:Uncharacterized protein n=1 Tax=Cinchona calisaya TaxID=153742 RepID=A0ABD2YSE5_9GENT